MSTDNLVPCPEIDVLQWNGQDVYVQCPYCGDIHQHGMVQKHEGVSLCYPGGCYKFRLPFDNRTGLVGYEIDKRRAYFVNAGLRMCQEDEPADVSDQESKTADTTPIPKDTKLDVTTTVQAPSRAIPRQRITKNGAVLGRGRQFAPIAASTGWSRNDLPPNERNRPSWIDQVYYIASLIGYEFPNAPNLDQGKPGRYYASHAEKKLIAYLIDRHAFVPPDRKLDQELERSILEAEDSLAEARHASLACAKVCELEERKGEVGCQLFDADYRSLGSDSYNMHEVKKLEDEIYAIDEQLSSLESDNSVAAMRIRQKDTDMLLRRKRVQQELVELSRHEPPVLLKQAVIVSSNGVCQDCDMFRKRVSDYFRLAIGIDWCT